MALTQKPISARINVDTLQQLESFCKEHQIKKNAVINMAIQYYLGHYFLFNKDPTEEAHLGNG